MRISKYLITFKDGSKIETTATSEQAAKNNVLAFMSFAPESAIASVTELLVLHDTAWDSWTD